MTDQSLRQQQDKIRIPFVQDSKFNINTADSTGKAGQVFVNAIPVKVGQETYLRKRPGINGTNKNSTTQLISGIVNSVDACSGYGLVSITSLTTPTAVGVWYDSSNGRFYIIALDCSSLSVITTVAIGSFAGNFGDQVFISEINIAGVAGVAITWRADDNTTSEGYYALTTANVFTAASLTNIASASFPANIAGEIITGAIIQKDGYSFIMTQSGKIYNSSLSSITTWNTLSVVQAIDYPDQGMGLCRYKNSIAAMGTNTIEFFQDVGNPSPKSPLQRIDQAVMKLGVPTVGSFKNIDDTIYFIGKNIEGSLGLYRLNNYSAESLSEDLFKPFTPDFSTYLFYFGQLQPIRFYGTLHICITGGLYPLTWSQLPSGLSSSGEPFPIDSTEMNNAVACYSVSTNQWWYWNSKRLIDTFYPTVLTNGNQILLQETSSSVTGEGTSAGVYTVGTTGSIPFGNYPFDDTYGCKINGSVVDSTTPVFSYIQVNPIEFNSSSRKRVNRVTVVTSDIVQNINDTSTGNIFYFIYNRSDSANTTSFPSIFRTKTIPDTSKRIYFNNLGMSRKLSIAVASKSRMDFMLKYLEIDVNQGTN